MEGKQVVSWADPEVPMGSISSPQIKGTWSTAQSSRQIFNTNSNPPLDGTVNQPVTSGGVLCMRHWALIQMAKKWVSLKFKLHTLTHKHKEVLIFNWVCVVITKNRIPVKLQLRLSLDSQVSAVPEQLCPIRYLSSCLIWSQTTDSTQVMD